MQDTLDVSVERLIRIMSPLSKARYYMNSGDMRRAKQEAEKIYSDCVHMYNSSGFIASMHSAMSTATEFDLSKAKLAAAQREILTYCLYEEMAYTSCPENSEEKRNERKAFEKKSKPSSKMRKDCMQSALERHFVDRTHDLDYGISVASECLSEEEIRQAARNVISYLDDKGEYIKIGRMLKVAEFLGMDNDTLVRSAAAVFVDTILRENEMDRELLKKRFLLTDDRIRKAASRAYIQLFLNRQSCTGPYGDDIMSSIFAKYKLAEEDIQKEAKRVFDSYIMDPNNSHASTLHALKLAEAFRLPEQDKRRAAILHLNHQLSSHSLFYNSKNVDEFARIARRYAFDKEADAVLAAYAASRNKANPSASE